jgi:predicted dehydrogenase
LGLDVLVYDVDRNRSHELATDIRATATESLDEALEQSPDLAVIATPSNKHLNPASRAARAGCHIFIEKPVSNTADGVEDLLHLTNKRGLVTMVGSNFRFHPAVVKMKELVDQGAIGAVVSARVEGGSYLPDWHPDEDYREMYSAKSGVGGALLDFIHELNYARWLFGEPASVTAMLGTQSALDIETEDTAALVTRTADGAIVEFHVDYVQRPYSRSCHIIGQRGTIRWEWDWSQVRRYDISAEEWVTEASWDAEWETNEMYIKEMKEFLDCIEEGRESRTPLEEGYQDLLLALAAKESATSGKHIEL